MQTSVRRGLAWMILSQGVFFVLQFGGSIVVARLLTPYEMGIYAVAYAFSNLLNTLRMLGLNSFLIREPELTPSAIATALTINVVLTTTTSAAMLALSFAGAAVFGDEGVKHVLALLSLLPLISLFEFLPAARLERIGSFRTIALVYMARVAIATAITILLAMRGFSYMSLIWGNLAGTVFSATCLTIVGWRYVSFRLGLQEWRRIAGFSLQILTISTVSNIAGQLSDLVLGRLIGLSALGLYARASSLYNLLWENLHAVIGRVVFVDFSERRRRGLSLRESYLRVVAMITGLLWPAFAGLGILSGPLIQTIYGATWISAALPLSLLAVAGMVRTSATMVSEIYISSSETDRLLRYEMKRASIGITLFVLGCLRGLPWAAASRIGEAVAVIWLCKDDLKRMTQTVTSDYTPIYRQSAALTLAACGPAAILMAFNGWSETTPLTAVIAAIAIGVAAWTISLWRFRHPLFIELESVARQLLRTANRNA